MKWNKGYNAVRRQLKRDAELLIVMRENLADYDDFMVVCERVYKISASLPKDDGAKVYLDSIHKTMMEMDWYWLRKQVDRDYWS